MNDDKANLSNVLDTAHKTFQLTFNFRNLNIASFYFFSSTFFLSIVYLLFGPNVEKGNEIINSRCWGQQQKRTSNVPMNWNVHMLRIMHYFRTDLILTCWFLIQLNFTLILTDYLFGRVCVCSLVPFIRLQMYMSKS